MAKLLDLCGERTRPALPESSIQQAGDPSRRGEHEPAPLDRRIVAGILQVEEVVILDEQQAVHDERRDRAEVGVSPFGIARPVKRVPVAVEQAETGARLFSVNRITALVDKSGELVRPFRLAIDSETMCAQRGDKNRQPGITQTLIIGSPFREADCTVRARPDREAHVPRQARKDVRLQIGGARLGGEPPDQQRQHRKDRRPAEHPHQEAEEAGAPAPQHRNGECRAPTKDPPNSATEADAATQQKGSSNQDRPAERPHDQAQKASVPLRTRPLGSNHQLDHGAPSSFPTWRLTNAESALSDPCAGRSRARVRELFYSPQAGLSEYATSTS